MRNVGDLIGIPFIDGGRDMRHGLDCWGLFMVAMARYGNHVPDFRIPCKATIVIGGAVQSELGRWEKTMSPLPGCAVLMALDPMMPETIQHFGVFVGDGKFLHTLEKTGSILSKMSDPFWKNKIKGFYRWLG